jgi:hypothetical protein
MSIATVRNDGRLFLMIVKNLRRCLADPTLNLLGDKVRLAGAAFHLSPEGVGSRFRDPGEGEPALQ